jgi:3-oxoacyl-[acyl-carrier-protein] synthase III
MLEEIENSYSENSEWVLTVHGIRPRKLQNKLEKSGFEMSITAYRIMKKMLKKELI